MNIITFEMDPKFEPYTCHRDVIFLTPNHESILIQRMPFLRIERDEEVLEFYKALRPIIQHVIIEISDEHVIVAGVSVRQWNKLYSIVTHMKDKYMPTITTSTNEYPMTPIPNKEKRNVYNSTNCYRGMK